MGRGRPDDAGHGIFERFVHSEVSGSVVLLAATIVALFWANSLWAESYFELIHTYAGVSWGEATFQLSLQHWVNDLLMVLFFFVVGLEIKREIVVGELSTLASAALPVSAALGGMVVPALLYVAINVGEPSIGGWGIPMATDIAFALGILALFGSRAPLSLKIFLTALAIADDIGAVTVIALFYTEQIFWSPLLVAAVALVLLVVANAAGVRSNAVYLLLALVVWADVLVSGVHATIAGILVAMTVPVTARIQPEVFLERMKTRLAQLAGSHFSETSMLDDGDQLDALGDMLDSTEDMIPPGIYLEHRLHPVQSFAVLPLFAFFNAGVVINAESLGWPLPPVSLGIIAGLVLGKQIGVVGFCWVAVRAGWARWPDGTGWPHVWGVACLAGVGFTMSLFISDLAFADPAMIASAKLGVLIASLISGAVGYLVLARCLPPTGGGLSDPP